MSKALVLSSGGCDSTVCVSIAVDIYGKENVSTVSIYYGQKHDKELRCSENIAEHYGLKHYELDLSNILQYSNCPLLKRSSEKIPEKSYADQIKDNGEGMVTTYVPFRNGLFLSAIASLAMSIYPDDDVQIYIGAHADDAAGHAYADCSFEFIQAMNKAIRIGTYEKVTVCAPLVHMNKAQVVKRGLDLHTPFDMTWSCYNGGDKACGRCGTCIDRKAAFEANGVKDPIEYEED